MVATIIIAAGFVVSLYPRRDIKRITLIEIKGNKMHVK